MSDLVNLLRDGNNGFTMSAPLLMQMAADRIDELQDDRDRCLVALTPSAETKAAYIGEVKDSHMIAVDDGYGEYLDEWVDKPISWDAMKEFMALIRKEAGIE